MSGDWRSLSAEMTSVADVGGAADPRPPVGSEVRVYSTGKGARPAEPRRAKVVRLYERFALVEFPAGYRECCFYDQMELAERRRRNVG